jgi:hypothetical protein
MSAAETSAFLLMAGGVVWLVVGIIGLLSHDETLAPVDRDGAEGEEVTNMDDEDDLKLIRQIVASDGRKYTAGNIDRSRYDRLVDLGWLTPFKTNISDVEYHVTEKGRAASAADVHD